MSFSESTSGASNAEQAVKEEHRTRFNTKFNQWLASKKHPNIKTDVNYDEIVTAVDRWAEGERFPNNKASYNYGSRYFEFNNF
jgi:hypothetical protein